MSLLKINVGSNMFENVVRHCSGLKIRSVSPLRPYVGSSTHWSNFESRAEKWQCLAAEITLCMYLPRGTMVFYSRLYTIQFR